MNDDHSSVYSVMPSSYANSVVVYTFPISWSTQMFTRWNFSCFTGHPLLGALIPSLRLYGDKRECVWLYFMESMEYSVDRIFCHQPLGNTLFVYVGFRVSVLLSTVWEGRRLGWELGHAGTIADHIRGRQLGHGDEGDMGETSVTYVPLLSFVSLPGVLREV